MSRLSAMVGVIMINRAHLKHWRVGVEQMYVRVNLECPEIADLFELLQTSSRIPALSGRLA